MPAMKRSRHLPFLCWTRHISLARHLNPLECARHSGQNPGLRISISASVSPQNPAQVQRESSLPDPPYRTMNIQGLLIFSELASSTLWGFIHQTWDSDCLRPWGTATKQQQAGFHGGAGADNPGVGVLQRQSPPPPITSGSPQQTTGKPDR